MSLITRLCFALLVINLLPWPCAGLRGYGNREYSKDVKAYKDSKPQQLMVLTSPALPPYNSPRRGLGISAWGIVSVIVSLFLAGMGFYYFSMCYPILCKKSRKYDMMGLPTVA